jgi:DNA modification methylase
VFTNRNFIGTEQDSKYFEIATNRIIIKQMAVPTLEVVDRTNITPLAR